MLIVGIHALGGGFFQTTWLSILNFISPFASLRRKYTRSRPPFPLHSTSPGASFLPPLLFCACPHMPALSNTKMPWRL